MGDNYLNAEAQTGAKAEPEWLDLPAREVEFVSHLEPQPDQDGGPGEQTFPWSVLPAASREILQNPETIDPLSLMTTDGCLAIASKATVPMVAYLSDGAERAGRLSVKDGRLNLTKFKELLKLTGEESVTDQGWLIIRPRGPLSTLRNRLSRSALGEFMRSVVKSKAIDLEPLARLHYSAGRAVVTSTIEGLHRKTLIRFGVASSHQGSHTHEAFAALGSIDADQWTDLGRGDAVRVGQAQETQRSIFERWMENGAYFLEVDPAAGLPDLMSEWTEFAPNGLPNQALLWANSNSQWVIRPYSKITYPGGVTRDEPFGTEGETAATMATAYAKGGSYESFDMVMHDMRQGKFEVAQRTDVVLKFQILPTHVITETFLGPPTNVKVLTYDEWPESMRQEFEETFKKNFKPQGN